MEDLIIYRLMEAGEEREISALITRVFNAFIAMTYSPKGIRTFLSYVKADSLKSRSQDNHFILVAATGEEIVGIIEMRAYNHISLLFVDKEFQHRGISRTLLNQAIQICKQQIPDLAKMTVNSSPYALPIYEKLGFRPEGEEQTVHGIRFIPMVLKFSHPQAPIA